MKILFPAFLLCFATLASAQKPGALTENICNFAGTITYGQFIGQSHNTGPDTIFLCLGDSMLIKHNGDAVLTGDPKPLTPPGIGYAFYQCPPTVSGDNLQAIGTIPGPGDPCLLSVPPPVGGLYATQGISNGGDTWFYNSGVLQQSFNAGQPLLLYFAPITFDQISPANGYEVTSAGAPPGPCVHVNTDEAFPVVYLNKIEAQLVSNNFGNDCIGRFRLNGGYPEFDLSAVYKIDIALSSDPATKAILHIPAASTFSNQLSIFSVTTPGIYNVAVEDGISCGLQFQIDMSGCNASDNVIMKMDSVSAMPGSLVCVPVRVRNFDIVSASVSFGWNPAHLNYQSLNNFNPAISSFFNPSTLLNTADISLGRLGMVLYNTVSFGDPISIPDNDILFNICFDVLDSLSSCTPIDMSANPALISFEGPMGEVLALTVIPGAVCATQTSVNSPEPDLKTGHILPNPIKSGDTAEIPVWVSHEANGQILIINTQGKVLREQNVQLTEGQNHLRFSTESLPAGAYFVKLLGKNGKNWGGYTLLIYP